MSSIEIDVSANIAKFKSAMDKAAIEGKNLNTRLNKAFNGISKAMKGLGALAGVAVAGGLASMGKQAINSADKIQKLSIRLGISSEALSQYRHVADQSGVSFETLTMGFQRMTRRVSEAANGSGEAVKALKELNISAEALNKLSPDKQFESLADALIRVENPADRVRLAMKLFDSEGVSLIQTMQGGAQGIAQMRQEADKLGLTLSKSQVDAAAAANDALGKLTSSISGAFTQSILKSSDSIQRFANWMAENLPRIINGVIVVLETLGNVLGTVFNLFGSFIDQVTNSNDALLNNSAILSELTTKTGEQLKAQQESIKARILEIEQDESLRNARGRLVISAQNEINALKEKLPLVQQALAQTRLGIQLAIDEAAATLEVAKANYLEAQAKSEKIRIGHAGRNARKQEQESMEAVRLAGLALAEQQNNLNNWNAKLADSVNEVASAFKVGGDETKKATKANQENAKSAEKIASSYKGAFPYINKVISKFKDGVKIHGDYKNAAEEVNAVILDGIIADTRAERIKKELFDRLKSGTITNEQYQRVLKETGLQTEKLEKTTGAAVTVMRDSWERFKDVAFSSLNQFWRDGLDGTKDFGERMKDVFKDMISGILTQITALLASNAFKKFVGWVSGNGSNTGWFDGLGQLFSGGGSGGNGSTFFGGGNSQFSQGLGAASGAYSTYQSASNGDYVGALVSGYETYSSLQSLGIIGGGTTSTGGGVLTGTLATGGGAAASTGITAGAAQGSAANLSAMGITSSGSVGGAGGAASSGLGVAGTIAGWAALAVAVDQLFFDGKGGREGAKIWEDRIDAFKDFDIKNGAIKDLTGQRLIQFVDGIFGGRSTDELGADQLREVIKSLEAGRAQALDLDGMTRFLGGYNEETTFFQTSTDADKDKISKLIQQRLGFGDVREIADGILRLEGQGTKFSEMSDEIISNVLASIAEVEIGFTSLERNAVKSMEDAFIEMDRIFDASADSGMEAQERVLEAIKETYGKSTEEAQKWLDESGLTAERYEEIFTSASGNVLRDVINTFESTEEAGSGAFANLAESARANFTVIEGGLSGVARAAELQAQRVANSYAGLSQTVQSFQGQVTQLGRSTDSVSRSVQEMSSSIRESIREEKRTKAAINAA